MTHPVSLPRAQGGTGDSQPVRFTDRLRALRNRCLGSPAFQRWAAGFPLTRGIAERRARELFDLCAGFVYSQVLLACVQLRVFERLSAQPRTLAWLATEFALSTSATERLLRAATALRLVERVGTDRYALGSLGAVMAGSPALLAMVEHHALVYRDLSDPVGLLRGDAPPTGLSRYWAYSGAERPDGLCAPAVDDYTTLMAVSQTLVCEDVLDAYALHTHRQLLDVGGGDGSFAIAAVRRAPDLLATVFDLPAVAERARTHIAAAGFGARISVAGGSFLSDALPQGADLISFVRVLHDHDDDAVLTMLRAAREALAPGGAVLIAEPMAGVAGAEPVGDAYFGFYLLAMGHGRARTAAELGALLRATGFQAPTQIATRRPLQTSLLCARVDASHRAGVLG